MRTCKIMHHSRESLRLPHFLQLIGLATAVCLAPTTASHALIVGNDPSFLPNTAVNPEQHASWTGGDPGWHNLSLAGGNFVYLGDGWVLSARHVGYNADFGIKFQTLLSDGSLGPAEIFQRIPGSYYFDYGYSQGSTRFYAVSNPTTVQSETGQTISLMDSRGTYFTDLQIFRINGDPGLPSLKIASEALPEDFTRSDAPEVLMIGSGRNRQLEETHWNVTQTQNDWIWKETTGAGTHQGYYRDNTPLKRFGTNRLADPHPNGTGDPSDPGAADFSDLFTAKNESGQEISGILSDTGAVLQLKTADGATRNVVSLTTVFDKVGAIGATEFEVQAAPGNSGSGLFYNPEGKWELLGIVNAIFTYNNQPTATGVYGNATLISDLSFYNQNYHNSISHIINSHPDYSVMGDVNLDGIVAGDGTGALGADDLAAFVAGWGYDNGTGVGDITSWKNGDLNRDGRVDVQDFFSLRNVLNEPVPLAVMTALFGSGSVVPEPGAIALLATGLVALCTGRRRRR